MLKAELTVLEVEQVWEINSEAEVKMQIGKE